MITSKAELKEYLNADKLALGRRMSSPSFYDFIWRFEIALRKEEYYHNCVKGFFGRIMENIYRFKRIMGGVICGYEIPINVFDKGLSIAHRGTIIVNSHARIGKNCRLHSCINIGTRPGVPDATPIIGDNVYIGPGVKIYGKITIANDIMIGANSVVNRDFTESSVCIAGAPANIIKKIGRLEIENSQNNG